MTTTNLIPVGKPELTKGIGSYTFSWPDLGVNVRADRITDDGMAELAFYHQNGSDRTTFHITRANLLSTTMVSSVARRLAVNMDIDWTQVLTYVTRDVIIDLRKGAETEIIGLQPDTMKISYQLWPFIQQGQPTTIFGPGSGAKTLLSQAMALSVQSGIPFLTWRPVRGNVLVLDWEAQSGDHRRRVWALKRGMGMPPETQYLYQWHSHPLVEIADSVRQTVEERQISLIILDSQMAAMGRSSKGRTESDLAAEYYACLRSFGCASLTIDHVNKVDWKNTTGDTGPYGSVVKFNRSRLQFEVKKKQEPGAHSFDLTLIHRKINEGMYIPDQGIKVNFYNNDDGDLDEIVLEEGKVAARSIEEPSLADLCYAAIREHGPQKAKDLAIYLDSNDDSISKAMKRDARRFHKEGSLWAINT